MHDVVPPPNPFRHLKINAGSLIVDGALVCALIWTVSSITTSLRDISARLEKTESAVAATAVNSAEISALKAELAERRSSETALRGEILHRIDIEDQKIDAIYKAVVDNNSREGRR